MPMAGVRCIRKPAAPGKPRPAPPLATGATGAERLPEASQCPAPSGPTPAGRRAPAREKTPPPHFYAARDPMKKREPFVPGKTTFRNPLCRTIAKLPDNRIHSSKNRRSEGLKMLSAGKSAKNKEKYRAKNTQRPESSPTGVFRPTLPHDKKNPAA